MKILIVEDMDFFQTIFRNTLEEKHQLNIAKSAAEAQNYIQKIDYDMYIIDLLLPDGHGYDLCSLIKSQVHSSNKPILIVSGQNSLEEKLKGFEFGATDYITKPFHPKELEARVSAHGNQLRQTPAPKINIGTIHIDKERHLVYDSESGSLLHLTHIEFKILLFFATHLNHVLSRNQILEAVWTDQLNVSDRVIDTHISNLRKKLGKKAGEIQAVHGSGYRLNLSIAS